MSEMVMVYEQQQLQLQQPQQIMESADVGGGLANINTNGMTIKTKKQERSSSSSSRKKCIEEEMLEDVNLSGMSLDALPNPSLNLAIIFKLDISNNNLEVIPESLTARLLNLVILDVHSNQLKSLPNSMSCLSKLKVLNVAGNLLQTLPKTIENCRALEEINANFNKLTSLPDTIGFELVNLKKISVNSNKLAFLPYSISHLTNLRILDARLNCLRALPDDLENLINLEILNVSQNFHYLTTLPYSIGLLISLTELDISYNKITVLPDSIGCLKKLQKLSAEGNPLVSPRMEIMEQSLHVIKDYLSEKMNNKNNSSPKSPRNKVWLNKFARWASFNGRALSQDEENERFIIPSYYRPIQGIATPRSTGSTSTSSPRRLFSPKKYFRSS